MVSRWRSSVNTHRELREADGLAQEELAAKMGIAMKNYQRIESGKQNLRPPEAKAPMIGSAVNNSGLARAARVRFVCAGLG